MNCSQLGVRILITALQQQQARQSREVQNISGIWRRGALANQRAGDESAGLLSSTFSIHRSLLLLSSSPPFLYCFPSLSLPTTPSPCVSSVSSTTPFVLVSVCYSPQHLHPSVARSCPSLLRCTRNCRLPVLLPGKSC